jgi:thioredoxin 1
MNYGYGDPPECPTGFGANPRGEIRACKKTINVYVEAWRDFKMKKNQRAVPSLILFWYGIMIVSMFLSGCSILRQTTSSTNSEAKVEKIRMLYFGATWCAPCQRMKRLFKDADVKKELAKLDLVMYDVDIDKEITRKWGIGSIPTMIFIQKGEDNQRYVGGMPKQELLEILRNL